MSLGLLLTLTEPPAAMEEEFNAWYDTEHLAERLSIPGFRSARRWVADVPPGLGKYLATYELDSISVLSSPPYLARFEHPTPWTSRCLGRAVVFKRWACEQLAPGESGTHPGTVAVFLGVADGALQVRRFRASSGATIVLSDLKAARPGAYRAYEP